MPDCELIKEDYHPPLNPFTITQPAIPTGNIYFFITDSNLKYEVRFGRRKDNFLGNVVNFGVLGEEFENEYSMTNKGETYRVIATVIEIVRLFHSQHSSSVSYEFNGDFKMGEKEENSIRSRLYYRYACRILCPNWRAELKANRVSIYKTC